MSNRTRTHILGRVWEADGFGVVHIEDRYGTGIDDLWSAITAPERIARWYGAVEGDLRPGGHLPRAHRARRPRRHGPHRGVRPAAAARGQQPRDGGVGTQGRRRTLRLDHRGHLTPDGDQTMLTLEVRGLPLQKLAAYGAGWQMHADGLACYLAGRAPGDAGERWGELISVYAAMAPRADGA